MCIRDRDDPQLVGKDNQAVEQIVVADRIIINKTDLASETAVSYTHLTLPTSDLV